MLAVVLKLLEALGLGWLTHKTDVAEQSGADKQALKDQGAADAIAHAAVDAAAASDQRRVLGEDQPAGHTNDNDPDLPYRD